MIPNKRSSLGAKSFIKGIESGEKYPFLALLNICFTSLDRGGELTVVLKNSKVLNI